MERWKGGGVERGREGGAEGWRGGRVGMRLSRDR